MSSNRVQDCQRSALHVSRRRHGSVLALTIGLCLNAASLVNGQSLVGGRNVNIAGGKQVISISPYEVRGDVLNRAQNEPSCAISTRNPKNILCGANDYRMIDVPGVSTTQIIRDAWLGEFQSADGGDTWESTLHRGFYLDPRPHPLRLLQLRAGADPTVRSGPAGLAFYSGISFTQDRSRSVVFVTTYADLNTREDDKQPFKFVRTAIPDVGTVGRFIDKPWMYVEAAPAGQTCTINAQVDKNGVTALIQQTVPASIVHLVYSVFVDSTDTLAQLVYVRSDNCGATFTKPKQLNEGSQPANGAAIAKPLNSTSRRVFTSWRRVQTPTSSPSNAIIGVVSDDNGTTWSTPAVIAEICPFDQGTTTVSFRTTAFPTMTADATGRAYVAWADRGRQSNGQCNTEGAARIRIATSTDGVNWALSEPVPSATPEHQILPSLVFTAGRLALAWLDFREDASQVFGRFVSEAQVLPLPGIRHTADVRASMATPGVAPKFDQPTLISEYLRGVGFANGQRVATQLQWNAVNRRWARRGTVPFNGDYIDIATLPYLPPDPATGSTAWIPNNQAVVQTALGPAPRVPLLLLAWTDNRDMRTGEDVDIPPGHDPDNPASPQPAPVPFVVPTGLNLPPGSIADPTQVRVECTTTGDVYKTGTTNQNAYTARATIGVAAGTPANNKVLGNLQRSFVVFVRNDTLAGKTFRLVASQPAGGFATFDQFDTARTTTDIFVPARSSVSRTVFVTRDPGSPVPLDGDAVIRVDVIETQGITPIQVTTIYINSDPSAPEIDSPEIDSKEIFSPEIDSPEIDSPEIDSPEIDSRGFSSPEIDSPEIDSPEIDSPEIDSPEIDSQEILSLGLQTPEIDSPEIDSPEIDSPEIDSPEIDSPEIDSSAITDITFKVTNEGNTTGQYNAKALVGTAAGPGFRYQVIVRRTYALPAVGADCQPTTIAVSKVAVNLQDVTPASPEIDSPEIDSPEIDSPEIDSAAIDTASFFVAPDETVEVVVRVRSKAVPTVAQLQAVLQNVDLAVQQEAVNSEDVAVGITEPPVITSFLSVATQALAAGQTTAGYAFALQASGGPEPHQWTLTGGTLPPGIGLSADGQLTGAPTAEGTFTFTVRVVDADGNMASRAFALSVTTPGTPALAFVTQPSNPILGAVITPYPSVRALDANGNPAAGIAVTLQPIGGGTVVGTLTRVTGPSGIAVFDDLRLTTPAAGTALLASAPTFTDATSVAFGTTQPDLIVESLTHAPINPTSVDSLTITAVVKNIGNGPSGPSTISLLVSGETPGDEGTEFPVPPLAPGATYTVQRLTPPVGEGPKTTSATIDGANTVTESAEGNNAGADSFVSTPQAPPVAGGLASWWRAEGDGNDSADGNHGTLIGGVEFGPGRTTGLAFQLDGVNDRIDVGPGFDLDDLTLSAWVFIDPLTNQGDRVVLSKDNLGGTGTRKAFVLKSSNTFSTAPANRPAFLVLIGDPPDPTSPLVDLLEGPGPLSAGWHHLAGVRDTSAGRFEFYIDGVLAASKVPTVIGAIDSMVHTVIGGVNPTVYGQFFAGRIDDPQIFNQALTAAEIAALATASSESSVVHSPVSAPGATTEPLLVRAAQGLGGDANRDLFVLHGNGQVSTMSGNGAGGFTLGSQVTVPGASGTARDIRVGDFGSDGNPDVVVAFEGASTNNLALVQSDGNLSLLPPVLLSIPGVPGGLTLGQLNAAVDPFLDVAVVSRSTNQLVIQHGSNAIGQVVTALPGSEPIAIAQGHMNKGVDGWIDLVVLNRGSGDVTVLLGNGSGAFTVAGTFSLGASPEPSDHPDALALADFNNDGLLDVAVAADAPTESVVVLLGNGAGGLGAGADHPVGANPRALTVADLDNDGNVDIATANPADNSISVLHGDGAGNFGPANALTAGNTPRAIIAVDVTNDGTPDLVVANQFQRASVNVDEVSTITSTAAGAGPFAVTTTSDSGPGSLRQAITNANARPGLDTITFNIPGPGPHVIALTSNLPVLTDHVTVDGTTQPGYTAAPLVELNGAGIGGQSFGLELAASGSTIRGLAIANFAPGDGGHGVLVNAGAGGTLIQANYIGLSSAGTPLANATMAFGLVAMAPTVVGGSGPRARNAIAGASTSEVTLGNGASFVRGNYIGTTADGSAAALPNATSTGIDITQGATYTIDSNVVSGLATGVFVNQPVTGLTFIRNLVGTNAAGNAALQGPASSTGISVNAPNITIGGTTAANGNTIAGYQIGIRVIQFGNALIRNNRIGTSSDGSLLLPGVSFGIFIESPGNTVTGNTIAGTIGVGVILAGPATSGSDISSNVLRDNSGPGITLASDTGNGNTLVPNTFTNNSRSIGLFGAATNDPGDADTGPNDRQNFPGLTGATPNGATTLVTGTLHSTPNGAFTIHIFQNAFCPASGRGEGTVIGTVAMSTGVDGSGSFSVALPGVLPGSFLSATATNLAGSTSEISDCVNVTAPPGVGTTLAFVAQPSSSAINAVISPAVAVLATDDGDGVAGLEVTLQLQGGTGLGGTLVRTTNADGVALFDDLSLGLPVANVTLLATAGGYEPATSTTFSALLPDLVVQSLTHTPANPATGAPITFNAVVRNAGTASAGASIARWSVTPGPNAALEQIPALAPGETIAIQRQVTLNVAQDYVSTLIADFTNQVQESNEANNAATENLTVTTGGGGGATFVVINTQDAGGGSLRQALLDANANAGIDSINFNIPGTGPFTITPLSPLPVVTGPVNINATTQPGYNGSPIVGLSGSGAGANAVALHLTAGSSVVRGLQISAFDGHGILIEGPGGNVIAANYLGVTFAGDAPIDDGNGDAIRIQESSGNVIGGTSGTTPGGACTGDCNVIVGRHASAAVAAIGIYGGAGSGSTTATGNQVLGNHIGTNAAGTVGMASLSAFGVLAFHAQGTIVGDGTPAGRNLISGNNTGLLLTSNNVSVRGNYIGTTADGSAGILNPFSTVNNVNSGILLNGDNGIVEGNLVSGNGNGAATAIQLANAHSNTISGNIIGLNAQGTAAVPNGFGVFLGAFTGQNTVGGATAASRNVISGNTQHGVFLQTESASNNTIAGNYIGLNAAGTLALGNQGSGVLVEDAPTNTLGGAQLGQRNVISGNSGAGVLIQGSTATGNVVRNNYIGTDSSGGTNLGNGVGVRIVGASGNEIAGAPDVNLIKGNLSHGVTVEGASATGNQIANNQIFDNGGLGIDLGGDGVTTNDGTDADTGPNGLQNFPVLTDVSTTSVTVTLQSTPNASFAVQLFSNAACDPSGNGEGQNRFDTLGLTTDGTGFGSVVRGSLSLGVGTFVTTAVTGPTGTSEFSACVTVTGSTVTLAATDPNASEVGPDPGTFTFTRGGSTTSPLQVGYSVSSSTAGTSPTDYTPTLTGTITIPAGQSSATFTLTPVLDALAEGNEDVTLTLVPSASYTIGSPSSGTVVITDAAAPISLALVGTQFVGIGRTATLRATLAQPAGAGGVTLAITADNTSILTVGAPGTISIPQGQSTGTVTVDGIAVGNTVVRANASGYAEATLLVSVTQNLITTPATLAVPLGQSFQLPINIGPSPAPAGGLQLEVVSANPSNVEVITSIVTVLQGQLSVNAVVRGAALGNATVTVSHPNYAPSSTVVTSTASVNIVQTLVSFNNGFTPPNVTVQLESNATPIATPTPVSVTLSAAAPACVAVPGTVTIPAGQVSTDFQPSYGGSAALPCTTTVTATVSGLPPDTVSVTVNPQPAVNAGGAVTVGSRLQAGVSASLGVAQHGGTAVTITSSDPARVVVAQNATTPGTVSTTLNIPNGTQSFTYYVSALENVTGSATVTVSATGFVSDSHPVNVVTPGIELVGLPASTTSLSASDVNWYAQVGIPNAQNTGLSSVQNVRAGGPAFIITIANSSAAVAQLTSDEPVQTGQSVTKPIQPGVYYPQNVLPGSSFGLTFDPIAVGTTTVSVTGPAGVVTMTTTGSRQVSVTGPSINPPGATTIGSRLQTQVSGSLSASQHGGVVLTVASGDPTRVLVAPNGTTVGTPSITVNIPNGSTGFTYVLQALDNVTGSSTITLSANGFPTVTHAATVVASGIEIQGLPGTTTTLAATDTDVYVQVGVPNAQNTALGSVQSVRAGSSYVFTLSNAAAAVAQLSSDEPVATGQTVTKPIQPNFYYNQNVSPGTSFGLAFDPIGAGTTNVTATGPPGVVTMTSSGVRTVTVTGPGVTMPGTITVAGWLQTSTSASLGGAAHGGVTATLTSSDPTRVLLSPNGTTAGTPSIAVNVPNNQTTVSYYIQGVENTTGSATISMTVPGFPNGQHTVNVVQGGVELVGLPTTTTTLSASDTNWYTQVGIPNAQGTGLSSVQSVRAGGPAFAVSLTNGNPTVAQLSSDQPVATGQTVTKTIQQNFYYPQAVLPGTSFGLIFDPLAGGTTSVTAIGPIGFVTMSTNGVRQISVTSPGISVQSAMTVGSGLQVALGATLGGSQHGGVDVTITSSAPSLVRVAPNGTTAGTDSIVVHVLNGQTSVPVYVQGLENSSGTAVVTVSAPGFLTATSTITVAPIALEIVGLPATISAGAAEATGWYVQVGLPNVNNTALSTVQNVRAGHPGFIVTLSNSNASAAQLRSDQPAATGQTVTKPIQSGSYYPQAVVAGTSFGLAFDPITAGTTTVTVTGPAGVGTTTQGSRTITVN